VKLFTGRISPEFSPACPYGISTATGERTH